MVNVDRHTCLDRIDSIVNQHCGNHQFCYKHHCKFKAIEFETRLQHKIMNTSSSEQEIKVEVNPKYADISRFRG